jgi:molybdate transport system permease protein
MESEISSIMVSVKLALVTTVLLFFITLPLAYIFTWKTFFGKRFFRSLTILPLALPPTVLGFYLLLFLGPVSFIGKFFSEYFDTRIIFSFKGILIASIIYNFPFMLNPLIEGFKKISVELLESVRCLGKSTFTIVLKIILPNAKGSILSALVLTFAHSLGEFGIILMIGGSIPGETRTASIAIYESVESLNWDMAGRQSIVLLIICFILVFSVRYFSED